MYSNPPSPRPTHTHPPTQSMSRVLQSAKVLKPATVLRPNTSPILFNTTTSTKTQVRKMSATGAYDTAGFQVPLFGKTERQPTPEEKALVDDVLNLCGCWVHFPFAALPPRAPDCSKKDSLLRSIGTLDTANSFPDQLNPISAAYARYAPSATFHDPIGLANGLEAVVSGFGSYTLPRLCRVDHTFPACYRGSVVASSARQRGLVLISQKAQFNGMPKVFKKSVTKGVKFVENPEVVSVNFFAARGSIQSRISRIVHNPDSWLSRSIPSFVIPLLCPLSC